MIVLIFIFVLLALNIAARCCQRPHVRLVVSTTAITCSFGRCSPPQISHESVTLVAEQRRLTWRMGGTAQKERAASSAALGVAGSKCY
jgi:hypothetical protein